jgi:hypothetical protein
LIALVSVATVPVITDLMNDPPTMMTSITGMNSHL